MHRWKTDSQREDFAQVSPENHDREGFLTIKFQAARLPFHVPHRKDVYTVGPTSKITFDDLSSECLNQI